MTQRPPHWTALLGLVLLTGLRCGAFLPDIDQRTSLLLHRSLLTHGLLVPLLWFALRPLLQHPQSNSLFHPLRLFLMGLCLALTVHLCFDLFPRSWRGFALIAIPLYGRSTALFSWIWLGLSCVVCLYLAVLLIRLLIEVLPSAIGLITSFILQSAGERSIPLAVG